jgi:hypothetical protein
MGTGRIAPSLKGEFSNHKGNFDEDGFFAAPGTTRQEARRIMLLRKAVEICPPTYYCGAQT